MKRLFLSAAAIAVVGYAGEAAARDEIRIVGSSTVFPFATAVAEQFGSQSDFPAPVVESTGSGGGLKLFCQGVGESHPDITNASRRIKESEVQNCADNGVNEITEVKVGYDGIVLANDKSAEAFEISREDLWAALAKQIPQDGELVENPHQTWADVNSELPDNQIEVLGPPPTSGTRDAFVELVMEAGCEGPLEGMELSEEEMETTCATIREDGAFIDAGENDNLIVQKLQSNPTALGIFGFSFLDQNRDTIQGSAMDGVDPTFEAIKTGDYPVSRSLFFYVKNAHVGVIPGMREYIAEFTSPDAWGPEGYLADRGLIPLPEDEREEQAEAASNLKPLDLSNPA